MMRQSAVEMKSCLGDGLFEREPGAATVLGFVSGAEPLASPDHQALVALPFGRDHPEAELPFLVLGDPPEAGADTVVSQLQERARDARDAVHLNASTTCLDRAVHCFGKALKRSFGICLVQSEISQAMERARQLLPAAALSR